MTMRIALSPFPIRRPEGLDDFFSTVDRLIEDAKFGGADLLVLPEYASMALAGAFVAAPDITAELDAVVSRADALVAGFRTLARARSLLVLPGSVPMRGVDGKIRNRAPLIDGDGRIAFQDKRVMTRFESERWGIVPGESTAVFETDFGRLGIAICYDSEFPLLTRAQVLAGADTILIPACTDTLHGFNRVRLSARARALENQCFTAVAPTTGMAPWSAAVDENRGYTCVFGPVDRGFPEDGLLARGALDSPDLLFTTLDPARLAATRADPAVRNRTDWPEDPAPAPVVRLT
ncbi:MAG TPA: carbon-nitrogen hydrolase family protein [Acidiphilium sp.]|uniref:carbon-nitrogen hydrolase family protein n=1 Tax=unclassified Acidiphilium TaxID=2617493 RepID=UPI000BC7B3EE|nr:MULTISPECIES: carbon-nitrogen hydrolase family protein [unclassified Acidiphilium]OYV56323.1 MAG: carbon-nitrogen hydrolase [Acidiphilium sp. 20-67-58]OYV87445.1 MAG: carbon-nitrogen hydrolase [Acidiphilium sp. 21-68-69]HQT61052.1 carbon-nitrogen hydrolase family protein [Acidiphilium sp.]HQU11034.1 carbon-nitrogen hydrolase family protein [Acidiphilium sp.]